MAIISKQKSAVFGVVLLALLAGCNGGDAGPETIPVTGVVTFKGAPVVGATLTFFADGQGTNAAATSDDDGKFEAFTTYEMGKSVKKGMTAGKYDVTLTKLGTASVKGGALQPPKNLLPEKYRSVNSSEITVTVTPGENNHFEFELK